MPSKLVGLPDGIHLPAAVQAQLSADLTADMTTYVTDAQTAQSTATLSAISAVAAKDAAEVAAASAEAPTDVMVASLIGSASDTQTAADIRYATLVNLEEKLSIPTGRAVAMSILPGWANGEWNYNGAPFIQDNLTTHAGVQYAVWWGADQKPYIAKRTLPEGPWSVPFGLSTVAANPLVSPVAADGHNSLVVAVDDAGYVHVSGNLHANPLRYIRSTTPGGITTWTAPGMIGTQETQVTYPNFVTLPNGTLLFFYRDGASGAGDLYANWYSATTSTWTRIGKIIDGLVSSESFYWNRLATDTSGNVHIFGCWRGTGTADTNNDFTYAKLTNLTGAVAATKADGTAQTLPITHANCELVIDTAATGSGMVNTHGADVDTMGRPHSETWLFDGAGKTQIQHVWHDGAAWHVDQVTNLTMAVNLAVSTISLALSRAQVVCTPTGETLIVYRCNYDGRKGTVRAIDVTPGTPQVEFPIAHLDLYEWEPCLDSRALRERGELHMLLVPLTANGAGVSGLGTDCWSTQLAGVLSIDLSQIGLVRAGAVVLPALRRVSGVSGPPVGFTVSATVSTDIQLGAVMVPEGSGQVYFARHMVRFKGLAADVVVTAQIRTQRELPTLVNRVLGTSSTTGTAAAFKETPWLPLTEFGLTPDARGWVQLYAYKAGTTNGQVNIATLEVAVLDYV